MKKRRPYGKKQNVVTFNEVLMEALRWSESELVPPAHGREFRKFLYRLGDLR